MRAPCAVFVASLLLSDLTAAAPSTASRTEVFNIIVVLDLSDRIDPKLHPEQAQLDLETSKNLIGLFEEKVRRNLYLLSRDQLSFVIAPQTAADYQGEIPALIDRLRIDMKEVNSSALRGKPGFDRAKGRAVQGIRELYGKAAANREFIGSDIWSLFRDHLHHHLMEGENVRNVIVVLTDGYLNFKNEIERTRPRLGNRTSYMRVAALRASANWKEIFDREDAGLISFDPKYRDVDVLITGLRYQDLRDQPIVERYWTKWLTELGVTRMKLLAADDSTAQTRVVIQKFLFSRSS